MWRRSIQFKQLELLGEGGQGRVFKAERRDRQSSLKQIVALKILHSETAVELWRQEFESLAKVRSPYCVQVLFFERVKRRPALVLEYVDGVSLAQLGQTCWLEPDDIDEINAQLELALKDLHAQGVFHGDLSPQNVLLDCEGRIRVLDFGLANGAGRNLRVTPQFAAPERLLGAETNCAADLFSLGRVLEFLRGASLPNSVYLHSAPKERRFQGLSPCAQRQAQLGKKVRTLRRRQQQSSSVRTRTQAPKRRKPSLAKALVLLSITFLLSLASPASQRRPGAKLALLTVRTHKWHYFSLNGRPIGYSPFSILLDVEQSNQFDWISSEGRGAKKVALKAFENKVLEDRDFSH